MHVGAVPSHQGQTDSSHVAANPEVHVGMHVGTMLDNLCGANAEPVQSPCGARAELPGRCHGRVPPAHLSHQGLADKTHVEADLEAQAALAGALVGAQLPEVVAKMPADPDAHHRR